MSLRTLVKTTSPSQFQLSFNIQNVDRVFPGLAAGDFAVFHGSSAILSLSMLLCVRAQLPYQLGGLETNVIFVDGGNTFKLYDVSYIAQLHKLYPRDVLNRIFISRAFTAYQMTSLIFEWLQTTVEKYSSKLVMISDIARLYLDKDVPMRESVDVFNQLTGYLSKFAEENRIIVVATLLPTRLSRQSMFLKTMICGRANVVASVKPSKRGRQFTLEKHPLRNFGSTYFQPENLAEFLEETQTWEKLWNPIE